MCESWKCGRRATGEGKLAVGFWGWDDVVGEKGSCGACLLVWLIMFGSSCCCCCCLGVRTVLGDIGGVLAVDVFEAEFIGLMVKIFPESSFPRGKEEVIKATTSAEIR